MIKFTKHTLKNGLKILLHKDTSTPMVVVNTLFNIGAKHESADKTGFAHLFEHLMFGGSKNIEKFDYKMEQAGGYSNAYTTNDVTNYYDAITAANLETVLWLESDRMNQLKFDSKRLKNQQDVVSEEYKQRYLNQPYGDIWIYLYPLLYGENNLYGWPTIGKEIKHVTDATLDDVKKFFYTYYRPENAILSIAGNIDVEKTVNLVEKYYKDIPNSEVKRPQKLKLQQLTSKKSITLKRDVPNDMVVLLFQIPERTNSDFYSYSTLADILGNNSSVFFQKLVKELQLCNRVGAFVVDNIDKGFFYIYAYANDGVDLKAVEEKIWEILLNPHEYVSANNLQMILNIASNYLEYSYIGLEKRAEDLAFFELLKDASLINTQLNEIQSVTLENLSIVSKNLFNPSKHAVIYYQKTDAK